MAILIPALLLPGRAIPDDSYGHLMDSWKTRFSFSGGIIHHEIDSPANTEIEMPEYLRVRKIYSRLGRENPDLQKDILTDNPLFHGASYSRLGVVARNRGIEIQGKLLMEHRGMSYGVFNSANTIVFPKLTISIDSSFAIAGEKFSIGLSTGNHDNLTLSEGLTIYNMDVQGNRVYLGWKNISLHFNTIGDMSASYDLNIGDVFNYSMAWNNIELPWGFRINLEGGLYEYQQGNFTEGLTSQKEIYFSSSINRENCFSLYTEGGVRKHNESYLERVDQGSNLIGVHYKLEKGPLKLDVMGERRYYGRYFNQGFRNDDQYFLFRDNSKHIEYNTIGTHLYPIHLFIRPFSQWAVYTEYQNRDVCSYLFQARGRYDLLWGFFISAFIDLNYLDASNQDSFTYPFYDSGVGWSPVDGAHCSATLTNRGMNLDERYPTLYLIKSPVLQLSCFYQIDF